MLRALALLLIPFAPAAPAAGAPVARAGTQDEQGRERIELRVTSSRPGSAVVDRGTADGLQVGDRVFLFPRDGGRCEGSVDQAEERSATVDLDDPSLAPAPGTRGEALVPSDRFEKPPERKPREPAAEEKTPPEHPPWENADEEWKPGQPLLARVRPLRPEERPASVTGRLYATGDAIRSTEDDRRDTFLRTGASVLYDNLYGRGDQLHVDGEINYRRTEVPDQDDEDKARIRLDRLSFSWGGTRFAAERWELGRFLQHGMPEFGVLDGIEWGWREDGGNGYGMSAGFMPEPDVDHDTGTDLQVAGYYRWVHDESEVLSAAAGFQKTFHDYDVDRDLLVGNVLVLPPEGWTFHGTAWVDLYTESDQAKGSGLEPTQILANAGRRWESGSSLNVIYTHLAFPEIDRDELEPVAFDQLADDHNDRLAIHGRKRAGARSRLHGSIGGWIDEDEEGGDGELGVGYDGLLGEGSLVDLTAFGTRGRFVTSLGGRISLSVLEENGGWSVGYELADHHIDRFSDANDDLPQHRLRASRDFRTASGWSLSGQVEAVLWDDENSLTAGFYIQRSF